MYNIINGGSSGLSLVRHIKYTKKKNIDDDRYFCHEVSFVPNIFTAI